jgi:hypothetical protein
MSEQIPRAMLLVRDQVFCSTGVVDVLLPIRPENIEKYNHPDWEMHEVFSFNMPNLYANGETLWFEGITSNLEGYYDEQRELCVLKVVPWDWGKVVIKEGEEAVLAE